MGRISMFLLNELHKVAWYNMIEYRSPESCSCLKDTVSQMSFPPHICFGVQMLCLRCYMFLIYWTRLQARFISTCHHLAKLRSWYGRIRHMEKTTRKIAARLHLEINLRDAWSRNSLGLLESKWSLVSVSLAEQNIVSVCLCERSKSVSSLPCHLQHVPIFSWLGSFRFIQENDLDNELTNDSELFGHLRRCTSLAGPLRGRLCGFYIDIIDMGMGRGIAIYQLFWFWCSRGPGTRILTIPDHPRTSIEDYPIYLVFDLDMVHLTTLDRKIMGQMVRRRLRHAPCHCSRPLALWMKSIPVGAWFDIHFSMSFSSGCWVKIRDHEMLDYQLNPTDSICVCSQACFCKFWRCFPT